MEAHRDGVFPLILHEAPPAEKPRFPCRDATAPQGGNPIASHPHSRRALTGAPDARASCNYRSAVSTRQTGSQLLVSRSRRWTY